MILVFATSRGVVTNAATAPTERHKRAQQSANIRGLYSMLSEQTLNIKNKPIKETNYLTTVTVMY